MFPDGRIMILNQHNQWVEIKPVVGIWQQPPTSQPPVAQASTISEQTAEEVLAETIEPELAELQTKARTSCPVVEEEDNISSMSAPDMIFLSSQDQYHSEDNAESESGTSTLTVEPVDLTEDFTPLLKKEEEVQPASEASPDKIFVQKYTVFRKVQVRSGPTPSSEKVCVLNPGQRVQVVKTKTTRTKSGFVQTKAYILSPQGQGWVSVNRQDKKTDETFVFKGQVSVAAKRLLKAENVWRKHKAEVEDIRNVSGSTFAVRVTCPSWEQVENLRTNLGQRRLRGNYTLTNKRRPQLVNLRRVFGNNRPVVHVFDLDVDFEHDHQEFLEAFDWRNEFRGSTSDFQHQVRADLRAVGFKNVRNVTWTTGITSSGKLSMRDYCTVEFTKDSHLRNFLKNFENYDFFKGAKAKVDPSYANLESIPARLVEA